MDVVVTGATGNLGTALLRRLAHEPDVRVTGVVRRPPPDADPYTDARWVRCDLTDAEQVPVLRDAVAGADAVVHLAWGFQPSHDRAYLTRLGVLGTSRVLRAVLAGDVPHLVHVSSVGAYSPRLDDAPVDEDWPTGGVPGSSYSSDKGAAERLLSGGLPDQQAPAITVLRPALVGSAESASGLLRYGAPVLLPSSALRAVPALPLDRGFHVPVVHADDVAEAVVRALRSRVGGAFNLSAGGVRAGDVAAALGARLVHVPFAALEAAAAAAWHARLQPLDPGWVRLARRVPLQDSGRARRLLGWQPRHDPGSVLTEVVRAIREPRSGASAPLRRRTVPSELGALLARGPVGRRRQP